MVRAAVDPDIARNVRDVETSFHLGVVDAIGTTGLDILETLLSAVPEGLEVRVFPGMLRNHYRDDLAFLLLTVSTDDPTVFENDLVHEYELLMKQLGFSGKEVVQVVRNGFKVALVEDRLRQSWLAELDRIEREL